MLKAENKKKSFTFNFKVSFYCDYIRIRALIFASVNIYKTKLNLK